MTAISAKRWKPCCDDMAEQQGHECGCHRDVDCPDALIAFGDDGKPLGLWIHDGGSSYRTINCCPWCRARLTA